MTRATSRPIPDNDDFAARDNWEGVVVPDEMVSFNSANIRRRSIVSMEKRHG